MDRKTAVFMSLGFEIVGIVFFSIYVGRLLDTHYDLNGLGTAGVVALGFAGWLTHIIVVVKIMQKKPE